MYVDLVQATSVMNTNDIVMKFCIQLPVDFMIREIFFINLFQNV